MLGGMSAVLQACTECGTEFPARANAVHCSTECRQKAAQEHGNAGEHRVPAATIGSLIAALETIASELEKHTADMNYSGTDEFDVNTFSRHPFDDGAYRILHGLTERMEDVSNDLYSAAEERQSYAALTRQQKKARTQEFTQLAKDAQATAGRTARWQRDATARETAWAALPRELTAPGRHHESVTRCPDCDGLVETISGVHRCWTCFRRSQDGR